MAQIALPAPRLPVSVRPATMQDLPFIDSLQKKQKEQLGFMYTGTLEGKIRLGHVLVAEDRVSGFGCRVSGECIDPNPEPQNPKPDLLGYCIGNDQYHKHDDVGIVYQLNVSPGKRRSLVGATLIKALFDRAAYGCKLFCCWCAQDIEANHFWESIGFVPLAFRTGSRGKGRKGQARIHIFWQKRIREGDTTTPWWFPALTTGGAIGEGRLVLPIPPGTRWSDAKPVVLPGEEEQDRGSGVGVRVSGEGRKRLPGSSRNPKPEARNPTQRNPTQRNPNQVAIVVGGRIKYVDRPGHDPRKPAEVAPAPSTALGAGEKPKKPRRAKAKNDPKHVAAARELRDRWMEHVNSGALVLESAGKYDVARALPPAVAASAVATTATPTAALSAARSPLKQLPHAA